jgi:hypothetical protein
MKTSTFYLVAVATFVCITLAQSYAATIAAGTTLLVRTLEPISSVDSPGKRFQARLETNVGVSGKVILPAGTKVSGKVETSRRMTMSSEPLTVNLTDVQFGGRKVHIKTTGAYQLNSFTTSRGVGISGHSYVVASGRKMEFRLAAPLNL